MKVRDPIVLIPDKPPDLHRMIFPTVERSIHKLDLWNLCLKKPRQLLLHKVKSAKPHSLVNRRQTVCTGKRATATALIINDAMLQLFCVHTLIGKRNLAHIHIRADSRLYHACTVRTPVCQTDNLLPVFRISARSHTVFKQLCKRLFPLSFHHEIHHWILL